MSRDPEQIITDLARQFPALKNAPGLNPWNPKALDEWASSGDASSGERAVVRFLLAVWNGSEDFWKVGPFRLIDLNTFNDADLTVFQTWAKRPSFL